MKIVTLATSAGPKGNLSDGQVVEVPDAFGKHLVEIGAARFAPADAKVAAEWPHATDVPAPEVATASKKGETR